jgi:hypothetical protein
MDFNTRLKIFSYELTEKARHGKKSHFFCWNGKNIFFRKFTWKLSCKKYEKIFFSVNSHENFLVKNMKATSFLFVYFNLYDL